MALFVLAYGISIQEYLGLTLGQREAFNEAAEELRRRANSG